jgi:hypothetical protein
MTLAHMALFTGGVLVLLLAGGAAWASRRRGYRLRDLTDLSNDIDPDWERTRRTMGTPEVPRGRGGPAGGPGNGKKVDPPQEGSC